MPVDLLCTPGHAGTFREVELMLNVWENLKGIIFAVDKLCECGNGRLLWEEVTSLQPLGDLADSFFACSCDSKGNA